MKGIPEQGNDISQVRDPDDYYYLETLQLDSPPFIENTDPASAFMTDEWQQNLDQLTHLVQSSDLLLAVSADDGLGKSTLLKLFTQQTEQHLRCCTIDVSDSLNVRQLLEMLANCYDLPAEGSDNELLQQLFDQGIDLQRNDIKPVIILDNAQQLQTDTLDLLLKIQSASSQQSIWRILFFTTPTLTTRLIQMQSHLHVIQLTPLDRPTTSRYLLHKLIHSGLQQAMPFTDKDIKFIHQHSHGNISQINLLAHQVLLNKYKRTSQVMNNNKSQETTHFIRKPGVWVSIVAVVILSVVLFFQSKINQLVEPETDNESILAQPSFNLPVDKEYLLKKLPDTITVAEKPRDTTNSGDIEKTPVTETVSQDEEPAELTPVEIISEPTEPTTESNTATNATVEQGTSKISSSDPFQGQLDKHGIKNKDWIMEQASKSVTAQMMASSKPDALIRQAKNPALEGQAAIYKVVRKNKDWFVMVYGSYPDKDSMRKAIDKLPLKLKKGKPWVRPMSAIQSEIQSGKK